MLFKISALILALCFLQPLSLNAYCDECDEIFSDGCDDCKEVFGK